MAVFYLFVINHEKLEICMKYSPSVYLLRKEEIVSELIKLFLAARTQVRAFFFAAKFLDKKVTIGLAI